MGGEGKGSRGVDIQAQKNSWRKGDWQPDGQKDGADGERRAILQTFGGGGGIGRQCRVLPGGRWMGKREKLQGQNSHGMDSINGDLGLGERAVQLRDRGERALKERGILSTMG